MSPLDWMVERQRQQERAHVGDDRRERLKRLLLNVVLRLAVVVTLNAVLWAVFIPESGTVLSGIVSVTWGLLATSWAILPFARATAYRNGWLDGRREVREHYTVARDEGRSDFTWLLESYQRDGETLQ